MSILYDGSQQAIADEAKKVIAARSARPELLALLETTGNYDHALWDLAIDQGWTGIALPEIHGGLGLGLIELGIVAAAGGAAPAGAPFLNSNDALVQALLRYGDAELQARWLPLMAAGKAIGAVAFAEGSDVLPDRPKTTFVDGRINGTKQGVTAGLQANAALVWTWCEGEPALVHAELAAATRHAIDGFDNSRGHADLMFKDVPARVLLRGRAARTAALEVLARMAVVAAHEQLGGAEALLYVARDYALTRKAFGQPIGSFQSIKHRIAELYGLVEIARGNCIHAASREGEADFLRAAAAARLSATDAYDTAARDCVQIHGGIGVTWDAGLHLHMRRARSLGIELGSVFFWEDILVSQLVSKTA